MRSGALGRLAAAWAHFLLRTAHRCSFMRTTATHLGKQTQRTFATSTMSVAPPTPARAAELRAAYDAILGEVDRAGEVRGGAKVSYLPCAMAGS